MEKKKLYVNTKASRMIKVLRVFSWILAVIGIVAGLILFGEMEEEPAIPTLIAGVVFLLIAIFIKPVYVRTLSAEIEIAMAKEEYDLFNDPAFNKEIKA